MVLVGGSARRHYGHLRPPGRFNLSRLTDDEVDALGEIAARLDRDQRRGIRLPVEEAFSKRELGMMAGIVAAIDQREVGGNDR